MDAPDDGGSGPVLVSTTVDPDEDVAMGVLRAVAVVEDEPIEELPQLYRSVDPDALRALVEDDSFEGTVEFGYDSYWVCINGDHEIEIHDGTDSA